MIDSIAATAANADNFNDTLLLHSRAKVKNVITAVIVVAIIIVDIEV
jgi:hypothetical protein